MKKETFIKRSVISAPLEEVFKWHSRSGALERLSPPWEPLIIISPPKGILKGSKALMKIKQGPISIKWAAEHTEYEENNFFKDVQRKGPFASWEHSHYFKPINSSSCLMEDQIEYSFLFNPFGNFFLKKNIENKLERIFRYRHKTISEDLNAHLKSKDKKMNIVISGAGGVLGSVLIPFLTTGGHFVTKLVRRNPYLNKNEAFWDPYSNSINKSILEESDAVIHLSGENISEGRWTDDKKKLIIDSRVKTTSFICKTIANLNNPPKTLICASAIGYYGDQGNTILDEDSPKGNDFISEVCSKWEQALEPVLRKGIKVIIMRFGVVFTPIGGALNKLILPFKMGIGGKLGEGSQFISWISIDDAIYAIYHALLDSTIEGSVNVVSPFPVTNSELTETLGKILRRPTLMSIPSSVINIIFGQMGRELLLSSTRVKPQKLIDKGFVFRYPDLTNALLHLLGNINYEQ
ncbi:MAG: TIGR01777 family protein [Desulfobacterales bacterium]|nr:TIGR01777 family protein [Desulfobacterales bacterium]